MTSNFEWLNGLPSGAVWLAAISLFGMLVKQWVPLRKIKLDSDNSLITALTARVSSLEAARERDAELMRQMQRDHDQKISNLSKEHDVRITRIEAENDAVIAVLRHRLNNVSQCLDAMLMMLKARPGDAVEIIEQIEAMRARQIEAEAIEKATLRLARIDEATLSQGGALR